MQKFPSFNLRLVSYNTLWVFALVSFVINTILPIPMLVLGGIIVSWMANLPSPVRFAVEKGLGSGYIGVAIAGMLGSALWILMSFLLMCTGFPGAFSIIFVVVSSVLWIVYAIMTPWHPESKLSLEALSAPTVLTGCRHILELKCLIVINFCFMAFNVFFFVAGVCGVFGNFNQPPPSHHIITSTAEDGAADRQVQPEPPGQGDLEASGVDVSQPEQTDQTQDKPLAVSINIATMDGAG